MDRDAAFRMALTPFEVDESVTPEPTAYDEVAIWDRVLSPDEITRLGADWTVGALMDSRPIAWLTHRPLTRP